MELAKFIEAVIQHLPYLLWGIGTILGIFSLRYFKPIMIWIKGGIEDGDGKLQNKELQVAFFSILSAFIVISIPIWEVEYPSAIIYCTFAGAGILYAVNRGASAYEKVNIKEKDKPKEIKKDVPAVIETVDEEDSSNYI